jgi:hypothetical protein
MFVPAAGLSEGEQAARVAIIAKAREERIMAVSLV